MNKAIALVGVAVLLSFDVIGARQAAGRKPPQGPVRLERRAVADADGPFNALGATLFWGAWGYKFDRARLDRNLQALSSAGFDYVRVLGSVGGTSWSDRQTDPRWDDYDSVIAGLTDLAYDRYGLRVQWTLFGGAPFTPSGAARESLVDRFATMAQGRQEKIFAFEIANEARSNGFDGPEGIAELRKLGKRLNDRTPVVVALSDPAAGAACDTYARSGVQAATLHYPRNFGPEDPTRPLRRPWDYPSAYDANCRGKLPRVVFNNEPIGPESSVEQDDSASRIAAAYVMTFVAGNAAYVFHAGPGIRGGGTADVSGELRRHAHFDELPSFPSITAALSAAKAYTPPGLANWTRHAPPSRSAPMRGFDRAYSATSGSDFVVVVVGIEEPVTLRARRGATIEVRSTSTGKVTRRADLSAGEGVTLRGEDAFVLIGRTKSRSR
jgi:hypothetical protein